MFDNITCRDRIKITSLIFTFSFNFFRILYFGVTDLSIQLIKQILNKFCKFLRHRQFILKLFDIKICIAFTYIIIIIIEIRQR